jgi:hypothetical protein
MKGKNERNKRTRRQYLWSCGSEVYQKKKKNKRTNKQTKKTVAIATCCQELVREALPNGLLSLRRFSCSLLDQS